MLAVCVSCMAFLVLRYVPSMDFLGGSLVKNSHANAVWSVGQDGPLEKEMVNHSSILAWEIPWTEQSGRLQSMGLQ